jgi:hypothetical protein
MGACYDFPKITTEAETRTFNLTRAALHSVALSVADLFDRNATYSEKSASDGKLKVLVIRNLLGIATAYVSVRFPGDLLDRHNALAELDRTKVENHAIAAARLDVPEYQSELGAGVLSAHEGYPIEFDDTMFVERIKSVIVSTIRLSLRVAAMLPSRQMP